VLNLHSLAQLETSKAVTNSLMTLPNSYNDIYEFNLKRVEDQDQPTRARAFQVLSWLSHALGSLSIKAFQHALSVGPGDTGLDEDAQPDADTLVSICADFVVVEKETEIIRLVHKTAQDYLKKIKSSKFPAGHSIISSTCLAYLSLNEFSELCRLQINVEARSRRYPFYRYAAEYWPQHVVLEDCESSLQDSIIHFLASRQRHSADEIMATHRRSAWGADNGNPWTDWNRLSIQRRDSPLHAAATYGLRKSVNFLLEKRGYRIDQRNNFGETALHRAAQVGQTTIMDDLIFKGADLNAKVQQHYLGEATPMILASSCLQIDAVRVLLNHGVDVNAFDPQNRFAPLHFAASMSTELTRFLLDHGAEPNLEAYRPPIFPERGPMTSLHFSVYFSHAYEGAVDRVKILLDSGADINKQTGLGNTALHLAILGGHRDLTHVLLEHEAEIYLANKQDKSAVQLAQELGHFAWVKEHIPPQVLNDVLLKTPALTQAIWANDHPLVHRLLEQEVDIGEKDANGKSPWDYCILNANVKLAEILADHMDSRGLPKCIGSDAFDMAVTQMTAFDYTDIRTWESTVQICRRLLPYRKAINGDFGFATARSPISGYNKTFLIWAAWLGRKAEVEFLLECGADVDAQDIFLDTATHHAVNANNLEMVKLLVEKRANLSLKDRFGATPLQAANKSGNSGIKAYLEAALAHQTHRRASRTEEKSG
jgi:ankyrin repeat protein